MAVIPLWKPRRPTPQIMTNPIQFKHAIPRETVQFSEVTKEDIEFDRRRGVCTNLITEGEWAERLYEYGIAFEWASEGGEGDEEVEIKQDGEKSVATGKEEVLPIGNSLIESGDIEPRLPIPLSMHSTAGKIRSDDDITARQGSSADFGLHGLSPNARSAASQQIVGPVTVERIPSSQITDPAARTSNAPSTAQPNAQQPPNESTTPTNSPQSIQMQFQSTTPTNSPPPRLAQDLLPIQSVVSLFPRPVDLQRHSRGEPTHLADESSIFTNTLDKRPSTSTSNFARTTARNRFSTGLGLGLTVDDGVEEGEDMMPVRKGGTWGNSTPYTRRNSPPPPSHTRILAVQPRLSGESTPMPTRSTPPPIWSTAAISLIQSSIVDRPDVPAMFEGMEFHLPEQFSAVLKPLVQQITERGGKIVRSHRARYIILPIPKGQLATSDKEIRIIREAEDGVGQSAISWDWVKDSLREDVVDLGGYKVRVGVIPVKRRCSLERDYTLAQRTEEGDPASSPLFSELELPVLANTGFASKKRTRVDVDVNLGDEESSDDARYGNDRSDDQEESGEDNDESDAEALTPLEDEGEITDGEHLVKLIKQVAQADERLDDLDSDYAAGSPDTKSAERLRNKSSPRKGPARVPSIVLKVKARRRRRGGFGINKGSKSSSVRRPTGSTGRYEYFKVDQVDKEDVDWLIAKLRERDEQRKKGGKGRKVEGQEEWFSRLPNLRQSARAITWYSLYRRYYPFIVNEINGIADVGDQNAEKTAGLVIGERVRRRKEERESDEREMSLGSSRSEREVDYEKDRDDLLWMPEKLESREVCVSVTQCLEKLDEERKTVCGSSWSVFHKLYRNFDCRTEGSDTLRSGSKQTIFGEGKEGRSSTRVRIAKDENDPKAERAHRATRRSNIHAISMDKRHPKGLEEDNGMGKADHDNRRDLEWLQQKLQTRPRGIKVCQFVDSLRLTRLPSNRQTWRKFYTEQRDKLSLDRLNDDGVLVPVKRGRPARTSIDFAAEDGIDQAGGDSASDFWAERKSSKRARLSASSDNEA